MEVKIFLKIEGRGGAVIILKLCTNFKAKVLQSKQPPCSKSYHIKPETKALTMKHKAIRQPNLQIKLNSNCTPLHKIR